MGKNIADGITKNDSKKDILDKKESQIQSDITRYLDSLGYLWTAMDAAVNVRVHRRKIKKSWPDLLVIIPPTGKAWCIEVKTRKGVLKPGQMAIHEELRQAGAKVTVARCVDDVAREMG